MSETSSPASDPPGEYADEPAADRPQLPGPPRAAGALAGSAAHAVLLLLGVAFGVVGSFSQHTGPRLSGQLVPLVLPFVVLSNAGLALLAKRLARVWVAGAIPLLGWLATVLYFGDTRPEGDLVIQGDAVGSAFLLLGAAAGALTLLLPARATPERRADRWGAGGDDEAGRGA